jgi:hypothetical protein
VPKKNLMSAHKVFLSDHQVKNIPSEHSQISFERSQKLVFWFVLTGEGNPFSLHSPLKRMTICWNVAKKKILWALIHCFWAIKGIKFVLLIAHKYILSTHRTLFSNLFLQGKGILFSPIHCPLNHIIICWKYHKNLMSAHKLFLSHHREKFFPSEHSQICFERSQKFVF